MKNFSLSQSTCMIGGMNRQRGSALVTVVIFSAVILLIAAGSVTSVVFQTRSTGRSLAYKQSLALAEAGAEVAMAKLNSTGNTWSGWTASGSNRSISGKELKDADNKVIGTYSVTVYDATSNNPLIDSRGTAQIGSSGPVTRSVRVPVKNNYVPSPFGSYGIYARNNIINKNSNLEGTSAAEGNITIDISNSRTVGNLQAGGAISVVKGNTGTKVQNSKPEAPPSFPEDALKSAKEANDNSKIYTMTGNGKNKVKTILNVPLSGVLDFTKHGEVHFPAGTYYLEKLHIGANTSIIVDGPAVIYMDPPAGVKPLDFTSGKNNMNAPGKSADLQMFIKSGDIELGQNFHSFAGIYAPNSNAYFRSNTWLTGAIVAKNIEMDSNSGIKTVEGLLAPASSEGFLAEAWTELAP